MGLLQNSGPASANLVRCCSFLRPVVAEEDIWAQLLVEKYF